MKKYIVFMASLIALASASAYASSTGLWGVDTGGSAGAESNLALPTEILGIKIILFKAADFPEIFKSDLFLTSCEVKYADEAYLKIKAFEVLDGGEKELKHSPNYNDTETSSYCDNNSEKSVIKPYPGTQEFDCTLTAGANPGLTLDSKIKYKFYSSSGVLLGETSSIELKLAENGEALVNALVSAVAKYNTAVYGAPYNPPKDYTPSAPPDTDNDGQDDVADDFPSVANQPSEKPIVINTDTDGDGIDNGKDNCAEAANADQADADSDGKGDICDTAENVGSVISTGGGDCSLDPNATANGAGWLLDFIILGLPAALVGIRRKK